MIRSDLKIKINKNKDELKDIIINKMHTKLSQEDCYTVIDDINNNSGPLNALIESFCEILTEELFK